MNTGNPDRPFDWVQVNCVGKDLTGDSLGSSRVIHYIYKISGKDVSIIWRLQAKQPDFQVDPAADLAPQHDVRWIDGETQKHGFEYASNCKSYPMPLAHGWWDAWQQ